MGSSPAALTIDSDRFSIIFSPIPPEMPSNPHVAVNWIRIRCKLPPSRALRLRALTDQVYGFLEQRYAKEFDRLREEICYYLQAMEPLEDFSATVSDRRDILPYRKALDGDVILRFDVQSSPDRSNARGQNGNVSLVTRYARWTKTLFLVGNPTSAHSSMGCHRAQRMQQSI